MSEPGSLPDTSFGGGIDRNNIGEKDGVTKSILELHRLMSWL